MKRLHLEHGMAPGERDRAVRERDEVQQRICSLQAELETVRAQKLEAKGAAAGLAIDLTNVSSLL